MSANPKHRIFRSRALDGSNDFQASAAYLATLCVLKKAIEDKKALTITYQAGTNYIAEAELPMLPAGGSFNERERVIEPIAFYQRRRGEHTLYLAAYCRTRKDTRSFVPSRIRSWKVGITSDFNHLVRRDLELAKFEESFDQIVDLEFIDQPLEAIAELEPAADALREGNLEAALEVLAEVRPDEVASFSTKFLSGAINAHACVLVESVLFDHGVHWNGPVEPTSVLIDKLIAAVRSAAKSALG